MYRMISVVLAILPGCVVEVHEGDGVSATDVRDVSDFDGVVNTTELDVAIKDGPTAGAAVICDENLLEHITLELSGGELTVSIEGEKGRWVQIAPETDCSVELVAPGLSSLIATGSGEVTVSNEGAFALEFIESTGSGGVVVLGPIETDALEASATGSGGLELASVQALDLELALTGSGGASIDVGTVEALDLAATGSGGASFRGLSARRADVALTGSGDGELTVTESLSASLTGSGSLTVWGAPTERDVATTGSGDVSYAD